MSTLFNQNLPRGALNDFSCLFSDTVYTTTLAANTAQSFTVPGSAPLGASATLKNNFIAVFKIQDGKTVFVSVAGTAVVASGSFAATQSELIINGMGRHVTQGQTLSFITADTTAIISVSLYSVTV